MSSWPAPTRADHDRFCRLEGWTVVRNATGEKNVHHITYELALPDGRILRTRVPRPPDRTGYGTSVWAHILRDQLDVDEPTFWACVTDRQLPARSPTGPTVPGIPVEIVSLLTSKVGLSHTAIAAMTTTEAIERLNHHWAEQT